MATHSARLQDVSKIVCGAVHKFHRITVIVNCVAVDAIEQRDGKRPLKELEERSLKPYKRR